MLASGTISSDDFQIYGLLNPVEFHDLNNIQPTFSCHSHKPPKTRNSSAYALFFREQQSKVRQQIPNASFGQVSKAIAAKWESLTDGEKKGTMDVTLQEVRLYENHTEREQVDNMSELYAVLNSLECLEKVFSRDYILPNEYTAECSKLLTQYKVTIRLLHGMSVDDFIAKYRINCPAALERIREDRPITVRDDRGNVLKNIAEIVELFITFMDHLKLNMRTVDELFPTLSDLYNAINTMSSLPDSFEAKNKIKFWHDKLNTMSASEEISEEDARQMVFEVESAYNAFNRHLRNT